MRTDASHLRCGIRDDEANEVIDVRLARVVIIGVLVALEGHASFEFVDMNGPVPTVRLLTSPSASTSSFGRIQKSESADLRLEGSVRVLESELHRAVVSSGDVIDLGEGNFCGETDMKCSNDQATSLAVSGRPFIGPEFCHLALGLNFERPALTILLGTPGISQVALHDVGLRLDIGAFLRAQQAAVEEAGNS